MAKFLLLILILFLVFWFVFRQRNNQGDSSNQQGSSSATNDSAESMVVCAHCHLRIPESESLISDGRHYCCDEHRQLGAS